MAGIMCRCGAEHGDGAALAKVGWQSDGAGGAMLLANCSCGSMLTIATLTDASFCRMCGRMMHAELKIVAEESGVHCVACARRSEHAIVHPIIRRYSGA